MYSVILIVSVHNNSVRSAIYSDENRHSTGFRELQIRSGWANFNIYLYSVQDNLFLVAGRRRRGAVKVSGDVDARVEFVLPGNARANSTVHVEICNC